MEEAHGQGLVARGAHLLLRTPDMAMVRRVSQEQLLPPQLSFLATSLGLHSWTSLGASRSYSSLARPLQSPLQVLTLSRWTGDLLLLRLQHTLDTLEGGAEETLDTSALFTEFAIMALQETTLAANQPLVSRQEAGGPTVALQPGQIRTFLATVTWY